MHPLLQHLRERLPEGYDSLAIALDLDSGGRVRVRGNTVRLWFIENRVPLLPLLLLLARAKLPLSVAFDCYPWLTDYFSLKERS